MTHVYYNENDEFAADWLRNLIKAGLIADGEVDTRSIVDVRWSDLDGFTQCHFFAGIGGWSYALRQAGWPDDRSVWTGSCPCQPFSLAGAQKGFDDTRHLWPEFRRLIAQREPSVVFGEQVASATEWLGLVRSDLEKMGYAMGAVPIQAASAGADHLRDRYWFVADADDEGSQGRRVLPERAGERPAGSDGVAYAAGERGRGWASDPAGPSGRHVAEVGGHIDDDVADREVIADPRQWIREEPRGINHADPERGDGGSGLSWVIGADGKARRVKSGVCLLVDGFPNRVGLLRGFGNAIDHRPAKEFIQAYMTTRRTALVPSHNHNHEAK